MNLSNELAKRGHNISFLLPKNAEIRLEKLNLYPNLIKFHKLTIPHVDGLPYGAETTADVPTSLESLLATSFDELYDEIKSFFQNLKPHFIIFDFAYWIPDLAKEIGGIKTLCYKVVCPVVSSIALIRSPVKTIFMASTAAELVNPSPGYPSTTVVLRESEAKLLSFLFHEYGKGVTFYERSKKGMTGCDAIGMKTCREIEGTFCDYIATQFEKPVLYTGPVLAEPTKGPLEALPEGFKERVQEKGLILDCWVPQLEILSHKSVGCHNGYGSMWESLALCDCQLVLLPRPVDHILNARLMEKQLKVGVEMEKDENDLFTKENLFKSVKCVMDKDSQIGCLVKENHKKWKELLSSPGFMSNYIDNFIQDLHGLQVEKT